MEPIRTTRVCEAEEFEIPEPVSPTGQYFNSSALSISVLNVLESEVPLDDSNTRQLLEETFLPINPRFSSIMVYVPLHFIYINIVVDKRGVKQWKKVQVNVKDHLKVPIFPAGLTPESYDKYFDEYLTKLSTEQLPQNRPLWELHIVKYPTSNAAGNVIFKLHHALGDGFSIMGALLSCVQRADDPSLPLTFPRFNPDRPKSSNYITNKLSIVPRFLMGMYHTICDAGWSILKSGFVEDDKTSIRSGLEGVEFKPVEISTITFELDQIKEIKAKLGVTINDAITGIIFLGTRLYMQGSGENWSNSQSTALVLLNTRNLASYKSVEEMIKADTEMKSKWGNQFAFLHTSVPELVADKECINPLEFIHKTQEIIKRKKNSLAVHLTGHILETIRKYKGPEETAKYIHSTLKNSSMTISNMIGPVEQMSMANHPVKGMYFVVVGVPQSLTISVQSYIKKLRIAIGVEKGFIDLNKFKSCVKNAYELILEAANKTNC